MEKYFIREENINGDTYFMIYIRKFWLFKLFIERWNNLESAKIRLAELKKTKCDTSANDDYKPIKFANVAGVEYCEIDSPIGEWNVFDDTEENFGPYFISKGICFIDQTECIEIYRYNKTWLAFGVYKPEYFFIKKECFNKMEIWDDRIKAKASWQYNWAKMSLELGECNEYVNYTCDVIPKNKLICYYHFTCNNKMSEHQIEISNEALSFLLKNNTIKVSKDYRGLIYELILENITDDDIKKAKKFMYTTTFYKRLKTQYHQNI
jgi:hypothetical protein